MLNTKEENLLIEAQQGHSFLMQEYNEKFNDFLKGLFLRHSKKEFLEEISKPIDSDFKDKFSSFDATNELNVSEYAKNLDVDEPIIVGHKDTLKEIILMKISTLAVRFSYLDRVSDDLLSVNTLNEAVANGAITIDDMVNEFRKHLENTFK